MVSKYVEIKKTPENEMSYVHSLREAFGANSNDSAEGLEEVQAMLRNEEYAIVTLYNDYTTSREPQPVNDSVLYNSVPGLTEARWKSVLGSFGIVTSGPVNFRTELTTYVPAFFKVWKDIGDKAMHVLVSWMTVQLAALYANRRLILNFFGVKDAELRYGALCFSKAYILSGNAVFKAYIRNMLFGNARAQAEDIAMSVRQSFYKRLRRWSAFNENYSFIADWNYTGVVFRVFDDAPDSDGYGTEGTQGKPTADMSDSLVQNWINGAGPLSLISSIGSYAAIENLRFYMWMNDTVLLPYVFAFPLFDRDAMVEMNYGGVGAELARAISDYFVRAYKDDHPVEEVKQFMECVASSLASRAADSAAVNAIAAGPLFDAYRNHSQASLRRLPGLEHYAGAKLFFVAYCYTKCLGTSAGRRRRSRLQRDPPPCAGVRSGF
ncbi:hypothetical protein V5799_008308 [Amblyomma americanum]|uniref:Uncharacterized protein n=1 Tax=Amblyomma americanum TaxID=6943 RepID=A0AAQ4FDN0_AMBAM